VQDFSYLMRLGERLAAIAAQRPHIPFDPGDDLSMTHTGGHSPQFRQGERVHHRALGCGRIKDVGRKTTPSGREVVLARVTFGQGQSAKFAIRDRNKSPLRAPVQGRLL